MTQALIIIFFVYHCTDCFVTGDQFLDKKVVKLNNQKKIFNKVNIYICVPKTNMI